MHEDLSESVKMGTSMTIMVTIISSMLIIMTVVMAFGRATVQTVDKAVAFEPIDQLEELAEYNAPVPLAQVYARIVAAGEPEIHYSSTIPSIPVTDLASLKNNLDKKAKIEISVIDGEYYLKLVT